MSDAITLDKASLREQFVFPTNTGVGGTRAVNGLAQTARHLF